MKKLIFYIGLFFVMIFLTTGCSKSGGYYRSGKNYFISGDYHKAAENFSLSITKNPNKAEYYIDYGMALIGLGQYQEAFVQFDKVIMDKKITIVLKNNKRALRGKGIAYFMMQDFQEAINQFDKALDINVLSELDLDILYYKGRALTNIGDFKEAAATYSRIIDQFGQDAQVLADRAYTYHKSGEYVEGLNDYDKAITLQSDKFDYYFGKYYLLMDMGKPNEAQEVLRQAEEIKIITKADKYNLAKVHFYQGLYDQAIYELSESAGNGFVEANFYIGEIYNHKKDYPTAKYYYEKYIEEGGVPLPSVYSQIASCLMKTGEYKQAIPYLETGINYAHNDMKRELLKSLIIVYENLGDFENALIKLESYLASYPGDEDAKREEIFLKSRTKEFSTTNNP